jgi:hypothetical protein
MPEKVLKPAVADRMAELEERVREMERRSSVSGRSRSLMRSIVPPEASGHFRAAGREQLLGIRALVDHWIRRMESSEAPPSKREEIPID